MKVFALSAMLFFASVAIIGVIMKAPFAIMGALGLAIFAYLDYRNAR